MEKIEQKNKKWGSLAVIVFVVAVIIIPVCKRQIHSAQINSIPKNSLSSNSIDIGGNELIVIPIDTIVSSTGTKALMSRDFEFFHNSILVSEVENGSVNPKDAMKKHGYIQIKSDRVILTNYLNYKEVFPIKDALKTSDGNILIVTTHPDGEECTFSVMEKDGFDIVALHFIETKAMIYFFIESGFTTNIDILKENT